MCVCTRHPIYLLVYMSIAFCRVLNKSCIALYTYVLAIHQFYTSNESFTNQELVEKVDPKGVRCHQAGHSHTSSITPKYQTTFT